MKKRLFLRCLACALSGTSVTLAWAEPAMPMVTPAMREIEFDEFLHGMLAVALPIKMAIPAEYAYTALRNTSRFSAYWMRPEAARKAQRTGDMPADTGWMSGEVSSTVTYDQFTHQFVGLDVTSPAIAKGGFKVLESDTVMAHGYPVVLVALLHVASSKPIYLMYVATLAGENVVLVSYRAPRNNRSIGDAVWAELKKRVSGEINGRGADEH